MKKLCVIGKSFAILFLFTFMLMIFGPAEIYFANAGEFKFVYGEFAPMLAAAAVGIALILALILAWLPTKVRDVVLAVVLGGAVAGYLQIMFINKDLDLLGMNPEGYQVETGQGILNLCVWLAVIAVMIILACLKKQIWQRLSIFVVVFLLGIQSAALVSLVVSADSSAFEHEEGDWYISGEDQFTVSGKDNVIVIILDYFSNMYLASAMEKYPDMIAFMNDFTYYSNADCSYFGTYPSLAHMLTGNEPNHELKINDWLKEAWSSEKTQGFYQKLREQGYVCNIFTSERDMICGLNSAEILEGCLSNLDNSGQDLDVNYKLLFKTMLKMSGYRMFPYLVKPYLYSSVAEYEDAVTQRENRVYQNNYEFYDVLKQQGLSVDNSANYYIVQHLVGTHSYSTGVDGEYVDESEGTLEDTAKGCMVIVEEYINQLKELGVYDDATIIVTSDHGSPSESQVIYFIKEAHEQHEGLIVSEAPIAHTDYPATIAKAAGVEDYTEYGRSVKDIAEDEQRERTYWIRVYDNNYPKVLKYSGEGDSVSNVYYGYTYTGGTADLLEKYAAGIPDIIIPELDGFF